MNIRRMIPRNIKIRIKYELFKRTVYSHVLSSIESTRQNLEDGHYSNDIGAYLPLIRKYAHILEKGLLHPQWEPGHSGAIAQDLKGLLQKAEMLTPVSSEFPSLVWSKKILNTYDRSQESGVCLLEKSGTSSQNDIDPHVLAEFIRNRRSIRNFEAKSVEKYQLEEMVSMINWSATSCNRQTARVFSTLDPKTAVVAAKFFKGATGFGETIPGFIVFASDLRAYGFPSETFLPTLDVALGMQNVMLMAHSLGLGMTVLSWAQHDREEDAGLRKLFNIPDYCQILAGAAFGYPKSMGEKPERKHIKETLTVI